MLKSWFLLPSDGENARRVVVNRELTARPQVVGPVYPSLRKVRISGGAGVTDAGDGNIIPALGMVG